MLVRIIVHALLTPVAGLAGYVGLLYPFSIEDDIARHRTSLGGVIASPTGEDHRGMSLLEYVSSLLCGFLQIERLNRRIEFAAGSGGSFDARGRRRGFVGLVHK